MTGWLVDVVSRGRLGLDADAVRRLREALADVVVEESLAIHVLDDAVSVGILCEAPGGGAAAQHGEELLLAALRAVGVVEPAVEVVRATADPPDEPWDAQTAAERRRGWLGPDTASVADVGYATSGPRPYYADPADAPADGRWAPWVPPPGALGRPAGPAVELGRWPGVTAGIDGITAYADCWRFDLHLVRDRADGDDPAWFAAAGPWSTSLTLHFDDRGAAGTGEAPREPSPERAAGVAEGAGTCDAWHRTTTLHAWPLPPDGPLRVELRWRQGAREPASVVLDGAAIRAAGMGG